MKTHTFNDKELEKLLHSVISNFAASDGVYDFSPVDYGLRDRIVKATLVGLEAARRVESIFNKQVTVESEE